MSYTIDLSGRVAFITGASSGLGAQFARTLARAGAAVVLASRRVEKLKDLRAQIEGEGGDAHVTPLDVNDLDSIRAAVAHAETEVGSIDILVNNAGVTQPAKFLDIGAADYDRILDVSLRGTLHASQAVLPVMLAQSSGSIVCISSVSAQRGGGILGGPHYSAAKAGVLGLARAMAREYGGNNIRVNCVTPGLIATDINKGKIPEDKRQGILDGIPLGRIGEPSDVAGCVVFLASELSKYCTGITLDVNGGMLIH